MEPKQSSSAPDPGQQPRRFEGYLDGVDQGKVLGWARDPENPDQPLEVDVYVDQVQVATVMANQLRKDLASKGVGNGRYGFYADLPSPCRDGCEHEIRVHPHGTDIELRYSPRTFYLEPQGLYKGYIDCLHGTTLSGWVWDERRPDESVEVDVFIDEVQFKTVLADQLREDLLRRGIGNGEHGFSVPIPARLRDGKTHTIHVRPAGTHLELEGSPIVRPLYPASDRLENYDFSAWSQGTSKATAGIGPDYWQVDFGEDGSGVVSRGSFLDEASAPSPMGGCYYLRFQQMERCLGRTVPSLTQTLSDVRTYAGEEVTLRLALRSPDRAPVTAVIQQNFGSSALTSPPRLMKEDFALTPQWQIFTWYVVLPDIVDEQAGAEDAGLVVGIRFPVDALFTIDVGAIHLSLKGAVDESEIVPSPLGKPIPGEGGPDPFASLLPTLLPGNEYFERNCLQNGSFLLWQSITEDRDCFSGRLPEHWQLIKPNSNAIRIHCRCGQYVDPSYEGDVRTRPYLHLNISENESYFRLVQNFPSATQYDDREMVLIFYARASGTAIVRHTYLFRFPDGEAEEHTLIAQYRRFEGSWCRYVSRIRIPACDPAKIKEGHCSSLAFQIIGKGTLDIANVWFGPEEESPAASMTHRSLAEDEACRQRGYDEYLATVESQAVHCTDHSPLVLFLSMSLGDDPSEAIEATIRTIASVGTSAREIILLFEGGTKSEFDEAARQFGQAISGRTIAKVQISFAYCSPGTPVSESLRDLLKDYSGWYFLVLKPGDALRTDFADFFAAELQRSSQSDSSLPSAVVLDHDHLTEEGRRTQPCFKPAFSTDLFLEHDYIDRAVVLLSDKALQFGASSNRLSVFRRDCLMQLSDAGERIEKIDQILLHFGPGQPEPVADKVGRDAEFARATLQRRGVADQAVVHRLPHQIKVSYKPPSNALVTLVIPFSDAVELMKTLVESVKRLTTYKYYEMVLVNSRSKNEETYDYIEELKSQPHTRVIDNDRAFNFSEAVNLGAKHAAGDFLIFLNNDMEIITPYWIEELIGYAAQPGVGAVGGQLCYDNGRIQHGGDAVGLGNLAGHMLGGHHGVFSPDFLHRYSRNCTSITGACLAIRKDLFKEVGGFDEDFIVTGQDVEFGVRLIQKGYRNLINPRAQMFHFEKKSRSGLPVLARDVARSLKYYEPFLSQGDPYWNRCLSLDDTDWTPRKFGQTTGKKQRQKGVSLLHSVRMKGNRDRRRLLLARHDIGLKELEKNAELMKKFRSEPYPEIKRVAWFIPPFPHVYRGGAYTIMRFAHHVAKTYGVKNCFVVCDASGANIDNLIQQTREEFPQINSEWHVHSYNDTAKTIPACDIGICTLWTTAYELATYERCKGKFYLMQDYEPVFEAGSEIYGLIEETYRFGFNGLCNSQGVAGAYRSYGNQHILGFDPAVDRTIYYPLDRPRDRNRIRIVFYGRPTNVRNAFVLGEQALMEIKSIYGDDVEIITVGAAYGDDATPLSGAAYNLGVLPSLESVAQLYRTCDIGLVFMFSKHPSYQPLEYMASGCVTVTNINEANTWLLRDRENCLLVPPTVTGIVDSLRGIIDNAHLREKIVQGGLETVRKLDWAVVEDQVGRFLIKGER